MTPLYDYTCPKCKKSETKLLSRSELDKAKIMCEDCNKEMKREFPDIGGYQFDSGSASIRPKGAGFRKGKKG